MRSTLAIGIAAALLLGGCAGKVAAPESESQSEATEPVVVFRNPESPELLAEAISKSWNQGEWTVYGSLLTDDFQFTWAPGDPAAGAFGSRPFTRELEFIAVRRLFLTGTDQTPPMTRVALTFGPDLVVGPDPRPGKTFPVHQKVRVSFTLSAENGGSYRISGFCNFYVVRGDSAALPPRPAGLNAAPDPGQWWLERWEDGSNPTPSPGDAALPTRIATIGALKAMYLVEPARSTGI